MNDYFFNYIVTAHNKEALIRRVLESIFKCTGKTARIFVVLDGCTDCTESIVDQVAAKSVVPIKKIYTADVHEIKSINAALREAPQTGRGFNILLQDDVMLLEPDFENKIIKFYETIGYDSIGLLAFRHGANMAVDFVKQEIKEQDLMESVYGVGMGDLPLLAGYYIEKMVGVRSPECISTEAIRRVGIMDEQLAPYTYDDHDYSIRCLEAGMKNFVLAVKFESDLKWGGMRTNPHPEVNMIMERNRKYLYKKHFTFFNGIFYKSLLPLRWAVQKPAPGFVVSEVENIVTFRLFKSKKIKFLGFTNYFISLVKRPLKYYYIIFLRVLNHNLVNKVIRIITKFFTNPREFCKICRNKARTFFGRRTLASDQSIKGTTPIESNVLRKYSRLAKIGIVEIGVLDGGTTKEMAEVATVPIYGIDPIIPDSMNNTLIGSEQKIRENLKFYSDFHFFKDYSYNVVQNWSEKFDFLWIDGDHSIEGVARDFNEWFPLLAHGGFIAFHDSAPVTSINASFSGWPGPVTLVNSLKRDDRLIFLETVDSVSVFQKK